MKIKNQTINTFFITILFISTLVFTACGSDDTDEMVDEDLSVKISQEFSANLQKIDVPTAMKNSSNSYAQQATSQVTAVKGIANTLTTFFSVPDFAVSSANLKNDGNLSAKSAALNTQTYTWSEDGITVTYTITEESDRFRFSYIVASSDINGKLMDGYLLKDGSYSEVKFYDNNKVVSTIKITVDGNISRIEITSDDIRYILESNTVDNSGNLKLYEDNVLVATYTWNASGNGSFINHQTGETYTW